MGFADILGRMGMASASPADCLLGLERNGFISCKEIICRPQLKVVLVTYGRFLPVWCR